MAFEITMLVIDGAEPRPCFGWAPIPRIFGAASRTSAICLGSSDPTRAPNTSLISASKLWELLTSSAGRADRHAPPGGERTGTAVIAGTAAAFGVGEAVCVLLQPSAADASASNSVVSAAALARSVNEDWAEPQGLVNGRSARLLVHRPGVRGLHLRGGSRDPWPAARNSGAIRTSMVPKIPHCSLGPSP